ncbi:substrate-binding domain-containing protein [Bdellovibrio sp. 22V]|uniref:substrate-binding domain-containing protein n=1 Tax=Bdellovibrio TaxID=958 RepID=UPI0025432A95|nr:substrate-binding domain-containing protein [Bdellovibrio sp. 22V]WII71095.1 substrate-binding domain-containing protein [Bdellovibrio sp. 22V]
MKSSLSLVIILSFFSSNAFAKTWDVAVLYWSMKIEGQVAMRKGFEEEINRFNGKGKDKINLISYVGGEGRKGILNQVVQFDEALKKSPHAIVIQPTDNSALGRGLQTANEKKIPVIAYDQYIVNGVLESFITSDNYQAGRDNGDYIDGLFDRNQEIRLVVFEYPKVSSTIDRVDGFFDALRTRGRKFHVLRRYEAVDPDSGAAAVKQFLKDFPVKGSVDLILTVNDGGGLSIVKSLWEKKRTEIRHATFDGDPLSIENIKNKRLTVIDSAQFCAELGRESARTLIAKLNKESVADKKLIPTFAVTEKTLSSYPGWMGHPDKGPIVSTDKKKLLPVPARQPTQVYKDASRLIIKIGVAPLCPYLCEKGPGLWSGYIYDIIKDVAQKEDFEVEFESIPNSRLISSLKTRKINYVIIPADMVRYLDDIRIVGPKLGVNYTGALVSPGKKDPLIDALFIQDKKVVYADLGLDSTNIEGEGVLPSRSTKLTGADAADRMIKMIGDRRAEIALGDYNVLRYFLARKPMVSLQLLPTSLTGFNSLVLVSVPKEPEFGYFPRHLENWFLQSRENGTLETILRRYNLKDWKIFNRD